MLLEDDDADDVPLHSSVSMNARRNLKSSQQSQASRRNIQGRPPLPSRTMVFDDDDVMRNLRQKLQQASADLGWVLRRCEGVDHSSDGVIHIDDFLKIFHEELNTGNVLTKRELNALTSSLALIADRTRIRYNRLRDFVAPTEHLDSETKLQRSDHDRWSDTKAPADAKWAVQSGSVGEWLSKNACPAERRSFVKLIESLERFELETGLKITRNETSGDLLIPLGPSLRAKIEFSSV